LELLNRLSKVFKDYCGVLTEESIRKNFILIYELLDEMMDFGYPQITSTESLKICVHNEASIVSSAGAPAPVSSTPSLIFMNMKNMNLNGSRTKPSGASNIPISHSGLAKSTSSNYSITQKKNEIYVDIIEKLTVLFNANGYVVNSSIDGCIQMKSFLAGNPELRLALNEDLIIGRNGEYGSVILDDCNFHECVHLDEFEQTKTIHFFPPDGEFSVLNYRISTGDFRNPFKILPSVETVDTYRLEFVCTIIADIPAVNHGINITVRIPVPRCTVSAKMEQSASHPSDPAGSSSEYSAQEKKMVWSIRKFPGQSEMSIRVKITLDTPVTAAHRKEISHISMSFEIPMYNISNLQVRYLRISETDKSYNPHRWVRYVTQSSSYVYRLQL
jgi:AP-4 complex subunit mu-1